jgi:hypothetical protein
MAFRDKIPPRQELAGWLDDGSFLVLAQGERRSYFFFTLFDGLRPGLTHIHTENDYIDQMKINAKFCPVFTTPLTTERIH